MAGGNKKRMRSSRKKRPSGKKEKCKSRREDRWQTPDRTERGQIFLHHRKKYKRKGDMRSKSICLIFSSIFFKKDRYDPPPLYNRAFIFFKKSKVSPFILEGKCGKLFRNIYCIPFFGCSFVMIPFH